MQNLVLLVAVALAVAACGGGASGASEGSRDDGVLVAGDDVRLHLTLHATLGGADFDRVLVTVSDAPVTVSELVEADGDPPLAALRRGVAEVEQPFPRAFVDDAPDWPIRALDRLSGETLAEAEVPWAFCHGVGFEPRSDVVEVVDTYHLGRAEDGAWGLSPLSAGCRFLDPSDDFTLIP